MYEVELKVRADHRSVRERLDALDTKPFGAVEQADTYYDHPRREFAETDEALRVRRERAVPREEGGGTHVTVGTTDSDAEADDGDCGEFDATVTYKGPLVEAESKTREEVETGVDDGEAMSTVLRKVGFEPVQTVEKRRERFRLDGYTVALDTVEGLGEFVEVEVEVAVDDDADVEVDVQDAGEGDGVREADGDAEDEDEGDGDGDGDAEDEDEGDGDAEDEDEGDSDGDGSGETDLAAVEAAREDAAAILEALDLDPDDQIRTSYLGLLLSDGA